jgi:hypothetical protein
MKSYKYSSKERAERVAKTLGCTGYHSHNENGEKKYMPCKSHEIFKTKTKKDKNKKEEEVTELVDADGTWTSSSVPITDPASTLQGSTITDKIVGMSKSPSDPFLRGWYGTAFRESKISENDMKSAFGYHDTMFMDYDETVKYFQKKLGLDKEAAIERTVQQGKKPNLVKRAPKKIKDKKNFIDRLILKEKGIDENEDIIEDKLLTNKDNETELNDEVSNILKKNVSSLKSMAKKQGMTINQLFKLIQDEQ